MLYFFEKKAGLMCFLFSLCIVVLTGCNDDDDESTSSSSSSNFVTNPTPSSVYPDIVYFPNTMNNFNINEDSMPQINENSTTVVNRELNNTTLITVDGISGGNVKLIGQKDINGLAQTIDGFCINTIDNVEIAITLDDLGRPNQISSGNNKIVYFDWNNQTITEIDGNFTCSKITNNEVNTLNFSVLNAIQNELQALESNEQDYSGLAKCERLANKMDESGIRGHIAAKILAAAAGAVGAVTVPTGGITAPAALVLGIIAGTVELGSLAYDLAANKISQECKERTKLCNADQPYDGGVGQQNFYFKMGQAAAQFGLTYEFYDVPDRLDIRYKGTVIYSTGCVSNGQSTIASYSGDTDDIEVIVYGDCTNKGSTQWKFNIFCP